MLKVCEKMPSKVRLEKIGVHQSVNGQFTVKYFIFREIWKIPCVVQIYPVLYLNSLFSLSGKSDNQIPCFPCAVATLTFHTFFLNTTLRLYACLHNRSIWELLLRWFVLQIKRRKRYRVCMFLFFINRFNSMLMHKHLHVLNICRLSTLDFQKKRFF